jgi:hypothetical protein
MTFCTRCGKQIEEGQICDCSKNTRNYNEIYIGTNKSVLSRLLEAIKNRMGIGDPDRNSTDTYERGSKIVPSCIKPCDGEVPIKQYNIAVLRNLFRFARAEGRMQVTNKRVIFRAAGRALGSKTVLQQEFAIDELAGIEAQKNYKFSLFHLIVGIIVASLVIGVCASILVGVNAGVSKKYYEDRQAWSSNENRTEKNEPKIESYFAMVKALTYIIGFIGWLAFFIINKKFLLKLAILGVSYAMFIGADIISFISMVLKYGSDSIGIFVLISWILIIWTLMLYCIRPNFAIVFKTKGGSAAPIKICADGHFSFFSNNTSTGFLEVFPTKESEKAIREIGAILHDIQNFGMEK